MTHLIGFEELCEFVRENKNKKALITFHSIGDRDSVASAVAIASCFKDSIIVTPDFITNNARRMLEESGFGKRIKSSYAGGRELVIVVDANNLDVLGNLKKRIANHNGEVLFIDHHILDKNLKGNKISIFNNEGYNSSSSIVYEVLKRNSIHFGKDVATLLIDGIISDSADFQNSSALTFRQISELLEILGLDYSEVMDRFHEKVSPENRYMLIKDIADAKIEIVGRYLIIYGKVSEHPNIVADNAIRLGADASVFWTEKEKEGSISSRLKSPLDKTLSLHLGSIMKNAGSLLGGTGGGHPCAGGAYGPRKENVYKASMEIVEEIKERLG